MASGKEMEKFTVPGEDEIVRSLRERFSAGAFSVKQGIGDDAAVFCPRGAKELWVVTTDMLLEEIDFRPDWLTPAELGHKALAANLSDLAAMGARPRLYTVALALPAEISMSWIESFYAGMTRLADLCGAVLIGGDLSRSLSGVQVTICAFGETLRRKVVLRSGGRPGDALYVTGVLGKSAAGLELLRMGHKRGGGAAKREALKKHRMPQPRCEAGLWLAQSGLVRAMMDLSDGLSMDLPRLCEASGTGAEVHASRLPVFPQAGKWNCDPLRLALHGGEDFELLFAVSPRNEAALRRRYPEALPPITPIGKLTEARDVVLIEAPDLDPQPLQRLGFDHFRIREIRGQARMALK